MNNSNGGFWVYVSSGFTWLFGFLHLLSFQDYLSLVGMVVGAFCTVVAFRRNKQESAMRIEEDRKRTALVAAMVQRAEHESDPALRAELIVGAINQVGSPSVAENEADYVKS